MFKASVFKAIVFATALFSLLSFANAEQFTLSSLEEVTHYAGGDDFICSRHAHDDSSDIPKSQVVPAQLGGKAVIAAAPTRPAESQCYSLPEIRGPPAIVVIP